MSWIHGGSNLWEKTSSLNLKINNRGKPKAVDSMLSFWKRYLQKMPKRSTYFTFKLIHKDLFQNMIPLKTFSTKCFEFMVAAGLGKKPLT